MGGAKASEAKPTTHNALRAALFCSNACDGWPRGQEQRLIGAHPGSLEGIREIKDRDEDLTHPSKQPPNPQLFRHAVSSLPWRPSVYTAPWEPMGS